MGQIARIDGVKLQDTIERLSNAEHGSVHLDFNFWRSIDPGVKLKGNAVLLGHGTLAPHATRSYVAALDLLMERKLQFLVAHDPDTKTWMAGEAITETEAYGKTLPLAACVLVLRMHQREQEKQG